VKYLDKIQYKHFIVLLILVIFVRCGSPDQNKKFIDAAKNGNIEYIKKNINKKIDIYQIDKAFSCAVISNKIEILKLLIKYGANVNGGNDSSVSVLSLASYHGHLEVVKFLLNNGSYIDVRDSDGITPLMAASSDGHLKIVKFLVNKGANVNLKNLKTFNKTAFQIALYNLNFKIAKFLKNNGGNNNFQSNLMYKKISPEIFFIRCTNESIKNSWRRKNKHNFKILYSLTKELINIKKRGIKRVRNKKILLQACPNVYSTVE
jgi:ankyrin repeat protein